jgi:hypothetical protein
MRLVLGNGTRTGTGRTRARPRDVVVALIALMALAPVVMAANVM